jgi:hypothetical protein
VHGRTMHVEATGHRVVLVIYREELRSVDDAGVVIRRLYDADDELEVDPHRADLLCAANEATLHVSCICRRDGQCRVKCECVRIDVLACRLV